MDYILYSNIVGVEMSRLTQDGNAEPVSRVQILRREWKHYLADREQD